MPRLTALGERAREKLDATAQLARQGESIFDLFLPFVHDNAPIFRADNTRRLYRSRSRRTPYSFHPVRQQGAPLLEHLHAIHRNRPGSGRGELRPGG